MDFVPHANDLDFQAEYYNFRSHYHELTGPFQAAFRRDTLVVGNNAPSFRLPTVGGGNVDLVELLAENHVGLVFGSYAAPPVCLEISAIDELYRSLEGTDGTIIFVYTREVHPHEILAPHFKVHPPHTSMDVKFQAAQSFKQDLRLALPVAVDDLFGTMHLAYGGLPFSQAVVHKNGTLIHRAEWADADLLGAVFANLRRRDARDAAWKASGDTSPNGQRPARSISYSETQWFT